MCFVYLTEPGMQLSKSGGTYTICKEKEEVCRIPAETIEGIVLMGSVQISSPAVADVLRRKIPVSWITASGQYCGSFQPPSGHQALKQRQQVLLQGTPFSLEMGKKFIEAKVHNQIALLQRCNRTAKDKEVKKQIGYLKKLQKEIPSAEDRDHLLGIEGISAKAYFRTLGLMVRDDFAFSGRTKRPPTDPFNAMLSFGYTLLSHEIHTAIVTHGLQPYFGILHELRNGHAALVSDLLEEWRPVIVDSMVWSLVQHREIRPEHFEKRKGCKGVYLTKEGRDIFLRGYEKKMRTAHVVNGYSHTLRQCVIRQSYHYSRAIMHQDASLYTAYTIR